ncbi:TolC family protein [Desulfomarina sp.]
MNISIRYYRKTALAVSLFLFSCAYCPQAMCRDFDFSSAWQQLIEKSNGLQAEQANINQAVHKQNAARDLYLPQVNLNGGYLYLDDKIQLSPDDILDSMEAGSMIEGQLGALGQAMGFSPEALQNGFTSTISDREIKSSSLSLLWPIYTGGRITAAQDIAGASVAEARKQHDLKLYDQFRELCRRYFGVVLLSQLLDTRTEVENSLKIHLHHAQLMVENGQIAQVEKLQAEASHDKAKVDRKKAASSLRIARAALTRLLQEESPVKPTAPLFINRNLPDLNTFLKKTLADYPALAILEAKKQMAKDLVTVEEGKYYPEVALLGNYNLYEEDTLAGKMMPDWFIGLAVKIPLLERSGRGGKRLAAKSLIKKVDALEKQAREDLSILVEKTYWQLRQAITEYDGLGSSLKLAEKTLELREKAFDQGLATSLDVVDARLYVAGVKNQRSHAAFTYVTRLAELLAISGELDLFSTYQHSVQP